MNTKQNAIKEALTSQERQESTKVQPEDDSEFDWVVLSSGARVQVPRLPPQQPDDANGSSIPGAGGMAPNDKGFHLLDKVRSAWGSTAGAGSDFFHVYRKQRAREMARQEELEKAWVESEEMRKFQERRLANFKADEERAKKRSEKRKRKKLVQAHRKEVKKQRVSEADAAPTSAGPAEAAGASGPEPSAAVAPKSTERTLDTSPAPAVAAPQARPLRPAVRLAVIDDEDCF
eukprot:Gregarina_sp_Pseudo_9__1138@NODE_1746_length_1356_cov_14_314351_g1619_i0_p1_GENE_NODE_1746_length_1356_cov_14_314351_g1619_i0NODE_1746_length_1356_cov_14_314351_g1619_i0_p1_ORF_typecomplete_len232_score33_17DUF1168/PF06658_12/2_2e03DUF1168/PF06658_12/4_3e25FbpA/PF05833_11/0_41DUF1179/PF06678_11/1_2_NODE_1746_length_1356_cov_14_314351_g1619_i043738